MTSSGKQKVLSYTDLSPASALPPTSACLPTFRGKLLNGFVGSPGNLRLKDE